MTTPHYLHGGAIYTTDLYLDVLILADGKSYQLVDVEEFEQAYAKTCSAKSGTTAPGGSRPGHSGS